MCKWSKFSSSLSKSFWRLVSPKFSCSVQQTHIRREEIDPLKTPSMVPKEMVQIVVYDWHLQVCPVTTEAHLCSWPSLVFYPKHH